MPLPADYGGVIDVCCRLKALTSIGVQVKLHCFTYGRQPSPELEQICSEVYYYPRDLSLLRHFDHRPFIVASRHSNSLLNRILSDDDPVLIEGVHGTLLLEQLRQMEAIQRLKPRRVVVRAHNVEQRYYRLLSHSERNLLRRAYLWTESLKLRHYEPVLRMADAVVAVNDSDADFFRRMGCRNVVTLPVFYPDIDYSQTNDTVTPFDNTPFVLYHGDLSVPDNQWAVRRVLQLADKLPYQLVVAGRNPSHSLRRNIQRTPHAVLVESPDERLMTALQRKAQCTVLLTRQPTGFKVKLLVSLTEGKHCIVNSAMVASTGLAPLCTVADTPAALHEALLHLMQKPFTDKDRQHRMDVLKHNHSNIEHARHLMQLFA